MKLKQNSFKTVSFQFHFDVRTVLVFYFNSAGTLIHARQWAYILLLCLSATKSIRRPVKIQLD